MFHHLHIHQVAHNRDSKTIYHNHKQLVILKNGKKIRLKNPLLQMFSFYQVFHTMECDNHQIHLAIFCIMVMSQNFSIMLHNHSPLGVWIYLGNNFHAIALTIIFVYFLMVDATTSKQSTMFSQECPCANLKITTFNVILGSNGGLIHQLITLDIV